MFVSCLQRLLEQRKKAQDEDDDLAAEGRNQAIDQALAYCQKFKYVAELLCNEGIQNASDYVLSSGRNGAN
jgi:hypothetical protein